MPDTLNPTPKPQWRSSAKEKHRARVIEFGDDYEQRAPRSTFPDPKYSGTLTWEGITLAESDVIRNFWLQKQGYISFYLGVPEIIPNDVLMVSDELERIPTKFGYYDMTMTIRSVPNA